MISIGKKFTSMLIQVGWGRDGVDCGGRSDQIISWGGPIVTFRWDSANDVDFKSMSVREINGQAGPSLIPPGGQNFNMSSAQGGTLSSTSTQETGGNMNGQGQEQQNPSTSKSNDQVAIFEKNCTHNLAGTSGQKLTSLLQKKSRRW